MYEAQHRTVLIAEYDFDSDEITFFNSGRSPAQCFAARNI